LDELEKEELGNGRNEVNAKVAVDDEEYARMMSRLDELEKEELEAEFGNGRDEDNAKAAVEDEEYASIMSRLDELEKEEAEAEHDNETDEDEKMRADFDQLLNQRSLDKNLRYSEDYQSRKLLEQMRDKKSTTEELLNMHHPQQDLTDQLNCTGLTVQSVPKDEISHGTSLAHNAIKSCPPEKAFMISEVKENVQAANSSRSQVPDQTSRPGFDSHKAFPGSIIEHTHNIQTNLSQQSATSSQPPSSQPSKPVSRFKMQRR